MPAVQHSSKSTHRWENEAIVENSLKDLLLIFKTFCFFLELVRNATMGETP
jgi:hypothetical protein